MKLFKLLSVLVLLTLLLACGSGKKSKSPSEPPPPLTGDDELIQKDACWEDNSCEWDTIPGFKTPGVTSLLWALDPEGFPWMAVRTGGFSENGNLCVFELVDRVWSENGDCVESYYPSPEKVLFQADGTPLIIDRRNGESLTGITAAKSGLQIFENRGGNWSDLMLNSDFSAPVDYSDADPGDDGTLYAMRADLSDGLNLKLSIYKRQSASWSRLDTFNLAGWKVQYWSSIQLHVWNDAEMIVTLGNDRATDSLLIMHKTNGHWQEHVAPSNHYRYSQKTEVPSKILLINTTANTQSEIREFSSGQVNTIAIVNENEASTNASYRPVLLKDFKIAVSTEGHLFRLSLVNRDDGVMGLNLWKKPAGLPQWELVSAYLGSPNQDPNFQNYGLGLKMNTGGVPYISYVDDAGYLKFEFLN
jgi:hypothetical protein